MARRMSVALNVVFYGAIVCFLAATGALVIPNGAVGLFFFDQKYEVGMEKELLIKRMGPPSHTFGKGEPTDEDSYGKVGVKPANHELLVYPIHGFVTGYVAFVYVDESGKAAEIDLRNPDNFRGRANYQRSVKHARVMVWMWVFFALFLLAASLPQVKRLKRKKLPSIGQQAVEVPLPPYPERDFERDPKAAAFVKRFTSGAIERIVIRWAIVIGFLLFLPGTVFLILFEAFRHTWLLYAALPCIGGIGFSVPAVFFIIYLLAQLQLPRARCSSCGKKMERKWSVAEGRKRLFLICPACRKYVNTGLSGLALR